ncbi:MAG: beta-hydroxyacyl-ACP dehydratase [Planctomycetia bacterium]|nr:beta-hydroxyacyl-ACP dehydratase [Planctomycetia bacterium]
MNWYWIDRFTLFESGKRAHAVKTITRAESHLRDHFRFHPIAPASLIIEGLAQTAGLMINEATKFDKKVVLGKIPSLTFYDTEIVPGDVLTYEATADYINDEGSMATVAVKRNEELVAEGVLVFAHLGSDFNSKRQFAEGDLEDLVRAYGMYDVGVDADGNPLHDPSL